MLALQSQDRKFLANGNFSNQGLRAVADATEHAGFDFALDNPSHDQQEKIPANLKSVRNSPRDRYLAASA